MSAEESTKITTNPIDSQVENHNFFCRLREPPRLRTFEDHAQAIIGLPLDAVQLLLRSKLPQCEVRNENPAAAAIIKTLHDLRFWEPLVMLGLANSFRRHRQALEDDRGLLLQYRPSEDRTELSNAWTATFNMLNDSLPPATKTNQQAA